MSQTRASASAWGTGLSSCPWGWRGRTNHRHTSRRRRPGRGRPAFASQTGSPAINDEHFPDYKPKIPGEYTPRPRSKAEAEFLAIGEGARTWLLEAAAAGTARMNQKMAEAVTLAKMTGVVDVDQALGVAALAHRFGTGDLASILNTAGARRGTHAAGESTSLTQGTAGWAAIGHATGDTVELEETA